MKFLAITLIALFSLNSFANDGGAPFISVNYLTSPTEKGDVVTFIGGEAYKLYQVLPRDFVFDITRSLTITSDKRSMRISCVADPIDANAEMPVANPARTTCTV